MSGGRDLIAFLAGADGPVHIGPRACSRCGDARDLIGQRYCKACRREYRQERKDSQLASVSFHGPYPELTALVFLRMRAAEREGTRR